MQPSRLGRALTPLEQHEMALQQDMRERGRRLRFALTRKTTEIRDGWTARLIRPDVLEPRFAA